MSTKRPAELVSTRDEGEGSIPELTNRRILLAEDDTEMRRLLARALRRGGLEVVSVEAGPALLHALVGTPATPRFSLVVTDLRMPGMNGLDVVRRLRASGSALPVVLITAFGDEDMLLEAAQAGVTAVFSKPFDVDDLRTAVLHFLDARAF